MIRAYITMGKYIVLFKLLTFFIFHLLVTPPTTTQVVRYEKTKQLNGILPAGKLSLERA